MSKIMDLQSNGHLDWFFQEWVYGTKVPRYQFTYGVKPLPDGNTLLHLAITQSEVDANFAMLLPVFADFGKGMIRLGEWPVIGNSAANFDVKLPLAPKKVELDSYKEILQR
jgi:hypothetical protein